MSYMPLPNQREKVRGSLIYGPHTWFLVTPLAQRQRGHWRGSDNAAQNRSRMGPTRRNWVSSYGGARRRIAAAGRPCCHVRRARRGGPQHCALSSAQERRHHDPRHAEERDARARDAFEPAAARKGAARGRREARVRRHLRARAGHADAVALLRPNAIGPTTARRRARRAARALLEYARASARARQPAPVRERGAALGACAARQGRLDGARALLAPEAPRLLVGRARAGQGRQPPRAKASSTRKPGTGRRRPRTCARRAPRRTGGAWTSSWRRRTSSWVSWSTLICRFCCSGDSSRTWTSTIAGGTPWSARPASTPCARAPRTRSA